MKPSEIALLRLDSQHIAGSEFSSPKSLVAWMGAMQAQDFPMAKWSIGVRLPGATEKLVASAIDGGDILRTHLLRPTWHFVSPDDIYWLLDLTAPQIKSGQKSRDRVLELTDTVYSTSNRIIEKELSARGQLSREELLLALNRAGLATDQNRSAHLLMRAELDKIICSGATLRGKPSYALLAERVPKPKLKTREEALSELAGRYFTSRGPVTLQDFMWWSGLAAKDARQALESVKSQLDSFTVDDREYWASKGSTPPRSTERQVNLLPLYDEFLVSYADRSAAISPALEQHMKEISNYGVFRPIIVIDGLVVGIWKRTLKKDTMLVEIQLFSAAGKSDLTLIESASAGFARFWGAKLELITE